MKATKTKSPHKSKRLSSLDVIHSTWLKVVFVLLLLLFIAFNIASVLFLNQSKYLSFDYWQRYPSLKKTYYNSIYANKNGTWVPDEVLYAFNGGALLKGVSPILVNPEVPPTGNYIISLSILLFENENEFEIVAAVLVLVMMYFVGKQIGMNGYLALFPPALFSSESIFKNQLTYTPLLEMFHLLFLLCTLYFFSKAVTQKKSTIQYFLLSSFFLGLFISTKFFAVGLTVVFASIFVLLIHREFKKIIILLCTYILSVFVLLFSYIRVLIIGYPLLKFLGIQKWVFWYNKGHLHEPFSIWPLLIFGRWYQSLGKVTHEAEWIIFWPISVLLWVFSVVLSLSHKIKSNKAIELLFAWIFFYVLLFSFVDANARYLVLLIPILYIVGFWCFEKLFELFEQRFFIR